MSLAIRETRDEQMDAEDLPAAVYADVLRDLGRINRLTLTARPTRGFLGRAVAGRSHFSLLDVGFGEGAMLRSIAGWAAKRGITCALTGIDLNPRSAGIAAAATEPGAPIRYLTGDYADLPDRFDLIVSSLVAHHMTPDQLDHFLRYMEANAACGWFVGDLNRHAFAYHGFPLLARAFGLHRIVREDGQLSIARSYRPHEWPPILAAAGIPAGAARVFRAFPFRLCVERLR